MGTLPTEPSFNLLVPKAYKKESTTSKTITTDPPKLTQDLPLSQSKSETNFALPLESQGSFLSSRYISIEPVDYQGCKIFLFILYKLTLASPKEKPQNFSLITTPIPLLKLKPHRSLPLPLSTSHRSYKIPAPTTLFLREP